MLMVEHWYKFLLDEAHKCDVFKLSVVTGESFDGNQTVIVGHKPQLFGKFSMKRVQHAFVCLLLTTHQSPGISLFNAAHQEKTSLCMDTEEQSAH